MAFQLAAFLAGIGGITKGIGAITNNRDLMKIGGVASMAGASLKNMDSMLKPAENKSGLGILGKTTDENFSLEEILKPGGAVESFLPKPENFGTPDLKGGLDLASTPWSVPRLSLIHI